MLRADDPQWWGPELQQMLRGTRAGRAVAQNAGAVERLAAAARRLHDLYVQQRGAGAAPGVLSTYQGGWALTHGGALWAYSAVWSRCFTIHRYD